MDRFGNIRVQNRNNPNPEKFEGGIAGWVLTNRDDSSLEIRIKAEADQAWGEEKEQRKQREPSHSDRTSLEYRSIKAAPWYFISDDSCVVIPQSRSKLLPGKP